MTSSKNTDFGSLVRRPTTLESKRIISEFHQLQKSGKLAICYTNTHFDVEDRVTVLPDLPEILSVDKKMSPMWKTHSAHLLEIVPEQPLHSYPIKGKIVGVALAYDKSYEGRLLWYRPVVKLQAIIAGMKADETCNLPVFLCPTGKNDLRKSGDKMNRNMEYVASGKNEYINEAIACIQEISAIHKKNPFCTFGDPPPHNDMTTFENIIRRNFGVELFVGKNIQDLQIGRLRSDEWVRG